MQELYKEIHVNPYSFDRGYSRRGLKDYYTCKIYVDRKNKKINLKCSDGKTQVYSEYKHLLSSDLPEIDRPERSEKPNRDDIRFWTDVLMNDLFIDSFIRKHMAISRYPKKIKEEIIKNYNRDNSIVDQLEKDKICHISQFIFLFNKTPQELRSFLGKGLWAKLINNTRGQNNFLLKCMKEENMDDNISFIKELLQHDIQDIRRSVALTGYSKDMYKNKALIFFTLNNLDSILRTRDARIESLGSYYGGGKTNEGTRLMGMVYDAKRMAAACDVELQVNPKWSIKRFTDYHDGISNLYNSLY